MDMEFLINNWKQITLGIILLAILCGGAIFWLMRYKDTNYFKSQTYKRTSTKPTRVLVIYFTRSGNTEVFANEIARAMDADIIRLEAPQYSLDLSGQQKAGDDAWDENITEVIPKKIDMSKYTLVFLGSPIWWYNPAVPLRSFVYTNNFKGNNVVLFNTFNSRFKQEKIDTFAKEIENRGGKFIDHVWVKRGRIVWQKSRNAMRAEFATIIKKNKPAWEKHLLR
ncbi:MAG: flavodoxin [Leptospirales bacterium]